MTIVLPLTGERLSTPGGIPGDNYTGVIHPHNPVDKGGDNLWTGCGHSAGTRNAPHCVHIPSTDSSTGTGELSTENGVRHAREIHREDNGATRSETTPNRTPAMGPDQPTEGQPTVGVLGMDRAGQQSWLRTNPLRGTSPRRTPCGVANRHGADPYWAVRPSPLRQSPMLPTDAPLSRDTYRQSHRHDAARPGPTRARTGTRRGLGQRTRLAWTGTVGRGPTWDRTIGRYPQKFSTPNDGCYEREPNRYMSKDDFIVWADSCG